MSRIRRALAALAIGLSATVAQSAESTLGNTDCKTHKRMISNGVEGYKTALLAYIQGYLTGHNDLLPKGEQFNVKAEQGKFVSMLTAMCDLAGKDAKKPDNPTINQLLESHAHFASALIRAERKGSR